MSGTGSTSPSSDPAAQVQSANAAASAAVQAAFEQVAVQAASRVQAAVEAAMKDAVSKDASLLSQIGAEARKVGGMIATDAVQVEKTVAADVKPIEVSVKNFKWYDWALLVGVSVGVTELVMHAGKIASMIF